MAKEWYLMKSPHNQISGYEDQSFEDFGQEGFLEALDSFIGREVELCNYDLSEVRTIRAIITNKLTDTKLKTLVRHALVPIGTIVAGMYLHFDDRYWLAVGIVDNNGVYEKAVLLICNYNLTWLNNSGAIVQRYVNIESASQYNNGEFAQRYYQLETNQLLITMPNDNDCLLLHEGTRFIIDKRCEIYAKQFSNEITMNTENEVATFELTRSDSTLYDYTTGGLHTILVTQDQQHEEDGYYVINGEGYWLCKAPTIAPVPTAPKTCKIVYDSDVIYNALDAGIYTATFYDAEGQLVSETPVWSVSSGLLTVDYDGNDIHIAANNKKLINKSFTLTLSCEGYEPDEITITVKAFI